MLEIDIYIESSDENILETSSVINLKEIIQKYAGC